MAARGSISRVALCVGVVVLQAADSGRRLPVHATGDERCPDGFSCYDNHCRRSPATTPTPDASQTGDGAAARSMCSVGARDGALRGVAAAGEQRMPTDVPDRLRVRPLQRRGRRAPACVPVGHGRSWARSARPATPTTAPPASSASRRPAATGSRAVTGTARMTRSAEARSARPHGRSERQADQVQDVRRPTARLRSHREQRLSRPGVQLLPHERQHDPLRLPGRTPARRSASTARRATIYSECAPGFVCIANVGMFTDARCHFACDVTNPSCPNTTAADGGVGPPAACVPSGTGSKYGYCNI